MSKFRLALCALTVFALSSFDSVATAGDCGSQSVVSSPGARRAVRHHGGGWFSKQRGRRVIRTSTTPVSSCTDGVESSGYVTSSGCSSCGSTVVDSGVISTTPAVPPAPATAPAAEAPPAPAAEAPPAPAAAEAPAAPAAPASPSDQIPAA